MDFVDECYADKDLSLLKKLTLVIPTYNRNYYLSRCLWYHAHFPFGQIIVADSSPEEKKVVNRDTVSKVRKMFGANILYLEYGPETEKYGGDISRKWGDAVMHVETEYSIVCTDKEFLIPTTLISCIDFLNVNNDYALVDDVYYLLVNDEKTEYGIQYFYPSKKYSIDSDNPLLRLQIFRENVDDTYNVLSLRRASNHKYLYQKLAEYNIDDLRFSELSIELLSILNSKYKYLNRTPFKLRDITELQKSGNKGESSATRYPTLEVYKKEGIYDLYMERSVSCFVNELNHHMNICGMTGKDISNKVRDSFITFQHKRHFFRSKFYFIYMALPLRIRNIVRFILVFMGFVRPIEKNLDSGAIPDEFVLICRLISESRYLHKLDQALEI